MKKPLPKKKLMPKVEGEAAPRRADRPAYRKGGAVKGAKVNIIIAGNPNGGASAAPAPGLVPAGPPVAAMPPKPIMAGPPQGMPTGAPPTMARGGRMTAGAGSGAGRLQKCR